MKKQSFIFIIAVLFFPSITSYKPQGYNRYTVMLDGNVVGITSSLTEIYDDYREYKCQYKIKYFNKNNLENYISLKYNFWIIKMRNNNYSDQFEKLWTQFKNEIKAESK
mgnify:CR=1 FL=1